jgi:hypothetical protein
MNPAEAHADRLCHPSWCSRRQCTAYPVRPMDREYHRSEPLVVPTEDPDVAVFVHRGADPDGGKEYIEIAELELPLDGPFYEERPRYGQEIILPVPVADALRRAIRVAGTMGR